MILTISSQAITTSSKKHKAMIIINRQSVFNRDFYPTPENVIKSMLAVSDISGKIILEPSAGQGNIVDFLKTNGAKEVLACEINNKLRGYLSSKCQVIERDFLALTAERISHINMIVMNPPFTTAARHILHAWDIAPDGCEIVSLCNSNMLSHYSPSISESKIRSLIKQYGSDECLGDAFKEAERTTDASVSVIRLYKPIQNDMEFSDYFTCEPDDPEVSGNGLIQYDFVRDCVNRYVSAVKMFDDVMAANDKINKLTQGIGGCHVKFGATTLENATVTREYFKKDLQKSAWKWLFNKFNLEKFTTQKVMSEINKFVELQKNVPFTMKNIYKMVAMIYNSASGIMEQAMNDAFDTICSFSADNTTAGETWKTNSNYMINRRFIVPYMCNVKWQGYVNVSWGGNSVKINDVQKVLCFLTGRKYEEMSDIDVFANKNDLNFGELYDWGFFRIRCYKKGTMHFEFIDEDVWYKFNAEVAKSRGWQLPQQTKKGRR